MYEVTIRESSKELTARERIRYKDVSYAQSLDKIVEPDSSFVVKPTAYAILDVVNDKSDNGSYVKYIIEDADGKLYSTGSETFFTTFLNIFKEMANEGDYDLVIFKRQSQNYKGKYFLSCTIA